MLGISVIIPIYNVEEYVEECLNSVLAQSYDAFEILCIDDASTDCSMEIVKEYSKKYEKIKIITHESNRGLSAARNTGIEHANGKYIFFLDADDMIVPEALEELFLCAENNNLDEIYFNMKEIYESNVQSVQKNNEIIYTEYNKVYSGQEMFALFAQEEHIKIAVWRQFYRKEFLIQNNITFYEGILHEDNLFSFLCAMNAKRVMNINKEYYIYRHRKGSITFTMNEERAQSFYIVILEVFKYWNSHEFSNSVNKAIAYYFAILYHGFFYYKNICKKNNDLNIGTFAEQTLYDLIVSNSQKFATLSERKISKLRKAQQVIVFGAGLVANDIIQILQKRGIHIEAVVVSDIKLTAKVLCGLDVKGIESLEKYNNTVTIIIGVSKRYSKDVEKKLLDMGFFNLMFVDEVK